MKKLIIMLCACIFLFLACANDSANQDGCYIIDMANDGIITEADKEWWLGLDTYIKTAVSSKSMLIVDEEQTVFYHHSGYPGYSKSLVDYYYNDEVELSFDSKSGLFKGVHYFNLVNNDYFMSPDVQNSQEYAKEKAKEIAANYIDVDSYALEETVSSLNDPSGLNNAITLFTFQFYKCISDFRTNDYLYIQITSKGDLRTLGIGDTGAFDDFESIAIETDSLILSIDNKLEQIYAQYDDYSYNIVDQTLTITPENTPVIVCEIEVSIILDNGESYCTGVILATEINSTNTN